MPDTPTHLPDPEQPEQEAITLAELDRILRMPILPVPEASLRLLFEAACGDSGGCQAARYLIFWLAGQTDPTRDDAAGGIELRRLDRRLKTAALEVLTWWAGPTASDQPLYDLLGKLRERFASTTARGARA